MPVIKIIDIAGTDIRFGLWHIVESVGDLLACQPCLSAVYNSISNYHSDVRKCEKLAIYSLLFEMTGDTSLVINYDDNGKPQVEGLDVSISHTRQYAVLAISRTMNVAVDIECVSDRVSKITNRFMREDEDSSTIEKQLITWSVKETVYKLFPEQHLQYFDMRLKPFLTVPSGVLQVDNIKTGISMNVFYNINEAYILTYAYYY